MYNPTRFKTKKYCKENNAQKWLEYEKQKLIELGNVIINDDTTLIYDFRTQQYMHTVKIMYKAKA